MTFGARLAQAMDSHGPLCVGIDPHPSLLDRWGISDDVDGLRRFALTTLEALEGRVAALKPQSALFERFGSRGIAALEELIAGARDTGTLCILDAKRGDIGSTMDGYAAAYLNDDSPLAADAVTLSPYLGFGSLQPALEMARRTGRGVFVLALTSNLEGAGVQHARTETGSVAGDIAAAAGEWNARELEGQPRSEFGSTGLVVGATIGDAPRKLGIDLAQVRGPILAPGVGAQGAGAAELAEVFGDARRCVLASSSRGVLVVGPDIGALRDAAARAADEAARALGR
ncbi:MAG TPA: orotidine-5'-phosphate decarboxylase [Actinomycetales bacterium]|nr:orotidine-5'-phosphate decarboxylase [Actinomycetales bacterium]